MTNSAADNDAPCRWTLFDVLPQRPPMILLDKIVSHAADKTVCSVRIEPSSPFADSDGSIPSWVALEYMAQCAAAHSGICDRELGLEIRLGFLLGSRRFTLHVQRFEAGQDLRVNVHSTWSDGELASFACDVRDMGGALLADCELSAYSPHNIKDLLQRQPA